MQLTTTNSQPLGYKKTEYSLGNCIRRESGRNERLRDGCKDDQMS